MTMTSSSKAPSSKAPSSKTSSSGKASSCCIPSTHPDHGKELPKLNRVSGQLDGIRSMIMEKRYCPDILTQLRAARSALKSIEANILESHLSACVSDAIRTGDADSKVAELKEIFKRYDD